MDYFVGLDVGVEDTALCVVDIDGDVLLQTEVPTDPQAIAEAEALPQNLTPCRSRGGRVVALAAI